MLITEPGTLGASGCSGALCPGMVPEGSPATETECGLPTIGTPLADQQ